MRGTFCGSLAHADPASEWCLVAATLDATLIAKSTRGERRIAAKDFFAGIMSTALAEDELLAEGGCRCSPIDTKFGFNEFSRRAGDFAMARAGHLPIAKRQNHRCRGRRWRRGTASAPNYGGRSRAQRQAREKKFRAAAEAAAKAIEPLEDHQTNAEYRRDLVRAVVRRALEQSFP